MLYALFHDVFLFLSECIYSECGLQKASRPLPVGYRLLKRAFTHLHTHKQLYRTHGCMHICV